jgi:hypothetical protein
LKKAGDSGVRAGCASSDNYLTTNPHIKWFFKCFWDLWNIMYAFMYVWWEVPLFMRVLCFFHTSYSMYVCMCHLYSMTTW